jgi:hypothetical protein
MLLFFRQIHKTFLGEKKMKKETILIIAEKQDLGFIAKWIKDETGFDTRRFDIHRGFPSVKEEITHVFVFLPPVSKVSERVLFTDPHIFNFFHDKKVILELKAQDKKIEEFENKLRPIFRNNFKKEEEIFSSSKIVSS